VTTCRVYCLYAALKGEEEPSPWMLLAADEYEFEQKPGRMKQRFDFEREFAEKKGWEVREVVLVVPMDPIYAAFDPTEVDVTAEEES
jgi:hypothetical protein